MRSLAWVGVCAALMVIGCVSGDDSNSDGDKEFEGCGSDLDCRGERICEQGMCVDPDAPAGDGDSAGDGGQTTGDGDGDGDSAGDGDGDNGSSRTVSDGVVDDPALEQACIRDCEAKHAANCEMPIGSLDQCTGQCLIVDEINQGYCLDERRQQYDCLADGGYTCINGYPQPKSTCIAENQALATCNQEFPCRRFCEKFEGTECAPEGECFESCRTQEQGFEDLICSFDYSRLITCWGQHPSCNGDRPSLEGCQAQAAEVADCIALRVDECEGFCKAAELLGCGSSDCVTQCTPKLEDAACGYLYRRLLDCSYEAYDGLYLECQDGTPVPTADCESEQTEYDACLETSAN